MNALDPELKTLILRNIDISDHTNVRLVGTSFNEILQTNYFKRLWPHQELFDKCSQKKALRNKMFWAAEAGDVPLVQHFIDQGILEIEEGLIHACKGGNWDAIQFFIDVEGEAWDRDYALCGSLEGGHPHLVHHFIKEANKRHSNLGFSDDPTCDWNLALDYAVSGGKVDMVVFVLDQIEMEAKKEIGRASWNQRYTHCIEADSIRSALYRDQFEIARLLMSKYHYKHDLPPNYNDCTVTEFTEFFLARGWVDIIMEEIIENNRKDMLQMCATRGFKDWTRALYTACQYGHRDVIDFIVDHGEDIQYNNGLRAAAENGHLDVIEFLVNKSLAESVSINWNAGLDGAAQGGHRDLVDYFIRKGATDIEHALWWTEQEFCMYQNMIEYLKGKLADQSV